MANRHLDWDDVQEIASTAATRAAQLAVANVPRGGYDFGTVGHAAIERQRIGEIVEFLDPLGEHELARQLIADPRATVASARKKLYLDAKPDRRPAVLGMSRAECARYSFSRVVEAFSDGSSLQGFERELSDELVRLHGDTRMTLGVLIPPDVAAYHMQRDMNVATASQGGYLVQTAQDLGFVGLARGRMVTGALGAELVEGLRGSITIPRTTTDVASTWLSTESTQAAETQPTLGQIAMTAKSVATYVELSRNLAVQTSPAAQRFIAGELLGAVAQVVDQAALSGTGASGQPMGLLSQLTPTSGTTIALATIQTAEAATDAGVVDGSRMGWATTPTVARLLQTRHRVASTFSPLWTGNYLDGAVNDIPARSSTRVPASMAVLGDWAQFVIGSWGTLEVAANPYAGFQAGIIGLRCIHSIDVAVRRLAAFASVSSIT